MKYSLKTSAGNIIEMTDLAKVNAEITNGGTLLGVESEQQAQKPADKPAEPVDVPAIIKTTIEATNKNNSGDNADRYKNLNTIDRTKLGSKVPVVALAGGGDVSLEDAVKSLPCTVSVGVGGVVLTVVGIEIGKAIYRTATAPDASPGSDTCHAHNMAGVSDAHTAQAGGRCFLPRFF